MKDTDYKRLRENQAIIDRLTVEGLGLTLLKPKYRSTASTGSHAHTCNHGGGKGKALRRNGWLGNGSSRVTAKAWRAFERYGAISGPQFSHKERI